MKFLADENFPLASINLLLRNNIDVRQTALLFSGKPDTFILQEATEQNEIILTFDKDFGELIFKKLLFGVQAVVLFRLTDFLPETPGNIILDILMTSQPTLTGYLTVIDENKIRQKRIK